MPKLELYLSPPGTGKTTRCIELFRETVSKGKQGIDSRAYFILPSREHASRIQNLVLKKDSPGLFNAHILTINDLASRLLGNVACPAPTGAIRAAVVREILEEAYSGQGGLRYFEKVVGFRGFHELLADVIKEFKSNRVSIKEFEKLAQPLLSDAAFRMKFKDFSLVFKRYELRLKELGLREPEDNFTELQSRERLLEAPELVIFDGFFHFTRAQKSLIRLISAKAEKVVVTLTLPRREHDRSNLFEYPERTARFLKGIGFKETERGFSENLRTEDPALSHLNRELFAPSPGVFSGRCDSVRILEAPNRRVEAEMIAREIRRVYRERSCHFSDICVIFRSIGPHQKTLQSVFRRYQIPLHIHERSKLIESSLGSSLYRFLKLILEDWKREDLLFLLKSEIFSRELPLEEVLRLETAAFHENVKGGRESWFRLILQPEISDKTRSILSFFHSAHSAIMGASSVEVFSKQVEGFFSAVSSHDDQESGPARSCLEFLLKEARAAGTRSSRPFSAEKAVGDLITSIERALYSEKAPEKNSVQVYDAVMALPKEYKVVFLPGLLEREFPQAVTEDPLFKDRERKILNSKETILEERLWRLAGERYLFYMAATRAREMLFLSYPSHVGDGKPSLPSFFLREVLRCFEPSAVLVTKKGLSDFLPAPNEWETQSEAERGLAEQIRQFGTPGFRGQFPSFFPMLNRAAGRESFRLILETASADTSAMIRDEVIRGKMRSAPPVFSATRLETYLNCAFKYHAERTLRLREPLDRREEAQMGNLLHDTLWRYYSALTPTEKKNGTYLKNQERMLEKLLGLLAEQMAQNPFKSSPLYRQKIYEESMRRSLAKFVTREAELYSERKLVPGYFELGFGKEVGGELDYLKIHDEKLGEILLTGKIDRIDLSQDGRAALVVDYKRSRRTVKLEAKLEKGLELQLPVYLLAVKNLMKLELIGAELRILRDGGEEGFYSKGFDEIIEVPSRRIRSREDMDRLLAETVFKIRQTVGRIRASEIAVKPKSCQYCPYGPVCRFEEWKIVYEKN